MSTSGATDRSEVANDESSEPVLYPQTDDGTPDHGAALEELFGREPTPRHPVYLDDGANVVAVVGPLRAGQIRLAHLTNAVHRETVWRSLPELWADVIDGNVEQVQRRFE